MFPVTTGRNERIPAFTAPIQHRTGSPSLYNKARKRKTRHLGHKEVKLSLFEDEITVYMEISGRIYKTTTRTSKL